ncbi:hypothetical protein J6N69_05460 [bacterium]|nr:hypothetical protein [bacterium]MBP3846452.1 hypothetical protein [bacterium]
MKKYKNLEERSRIISEKLLESIYLLEILEQACESQAKKGTLVNIAIKNVNIAFKEVEKCRKMISHSV